VVSAERRGGIIPLRRRFASCWKGPRFLPLGTWFATGRGRAAWVLFSLGAALFTVYFPPSYRTCKLRLAAEAHK
jgi:hypothetical protein